MTASRDTVDAGDLASWIEPAARIGYAAKGVVYVLVGVLTAKAAIGIGGDVEGSEGVLLTILRQPFGRVLLAIVALGLACYAFWRFVQAIKAPEQHGDEDAKSVFKRGYAVVSGLLHASLVVLAVRMILKGGGSESSGSTESKTAELMSQPFGRTMVAIVGLIIIGVAIRQFYRAYSASFKKKMALHELSHSARTWFVRASRWALSARGIVFGTIGILLVIAAIRADPSKAAGFEEAMRTLESNSYGPWLFGFVALGLFFYGIFQFGKAKYRIIEP